MPDIHAKHYRRRHWSQLARSQSAKTHREGCTWTTGANGIGHATGGLTRPSPDRVLAKVKTSEQTNPKTPGWSLPDLALAVARFGLELEILSGWDNLVEHRNQAFYIALQGDSDVFQTDGCMGDFDGDHCIGIHPDESKGRWRVNDPMCPTATHRRPDKLREYAQKFANARTGGIIRFGVFKPRVPRA